MENQTIMIIMGVVTVGILLLYFFFTQNYDNGEVIQVLDADTIIVRTKRYKKKKMRLIGVDSPEASNNIFKFNPAYARHADKFVRRRLKPGTPIYLDYDKKKFDQYGRLLAYLYVRKTGRCLNEDLLRKGYGVVQKDRYNKRLIKKFMKIEAEAKRERRGVWSRGPRL
ncbi:thermonuclease family protein [uncultured Microscilla sp.]|uniref:thermonuclease family protein n=1 Tax=uncultured Microscilla sp. TaxID=432653 RepID=UPI0026122B64|nr:thermonuclease family protein [uncultured Microscilla sp.]